MLGKINTIGYIESVAAIDGIEDENDLELERFLKNYSVKCDLGIAPFIQEFLWGMGGWRNNGLQQYLHTVTPDIIFMPVFPRVYPHKVLKYIKERTKAKIVLYHADDTYTLRQCSINLLFWIYRFYLRKWVRNSVEISNLNYVISDIQKQEYEKCFHKKCKLLWKGAQFKNKPTITTIGRSLKIVYTGNIGVGRYKQLALIGRAIAKLNKEKKRAELDVYTMSPMTRKMQKAYYVKKTAH